MPEFVLLEAFPLTEVTGAGGLSDEVQPASQSETSDNAATRRTVILGFPRSFIPRNSVNCQCVNNRVASIVDAYKVSPRYAELCRKT
ncbi:hypothetical protein ACFSKS_01760 [Pseudocitrobacter faecalis]